MIVKERSDVWASLVGKFRRGRGGHKRKTTRILRGVSTKTRYGPLLKGKVQKSEGLLRIGPEWEDEGGDYILRGFWGPFCCVPGIFP